LNEEEQRTSIFGRKKKKFKNAESSATSFLIKMAFMAIFLEAYFVINFILGNLTTATLSNVLKEFNNTIIAESYYSFALNSQKSMFFNKDWPILNEDAIIIQT
jgi:hypothetical protein